MSAAEDDPRLLAAAQEYLAALEAGGRPDRRAFAARHPGLGPYLDAIDAVHAAAPMLHADAVPPPPQAAHGPEPLGDFRIVREIGRGGMGVVYEAEQLSLGRRVALKVLPFAAALDARQLHRFRIEAQAAAQLHHTNIVPVYAVGCERGVHYYAMQVIDGRPLDELVRDARGEGVAPAGGSTVEFRAAGTAGSRTGRGREAYRTAARIAGQVASALEYAHEQGVVHRDVKPANLLLDDRGNVWVTDFGLAQVSADAGPTRTGDVFGTLRYMSPEQAAGRRVDVDHRTDVYSLGATLYELLALEPVFPGQDRQTLLMQILHEEPRPPRQIDRGVPADLETVVLKALAKAPADRYATAGELAADLRRFLDERPVLARRPSALDRARKWARRHPAAVTAALVILAAGVVVLGATAALVAREKAKAERRAGEAEQRFQLARRSADDMIRIANEEDGGHPAQQALRRRLLEAALAYYQEFVEQRRDDPEARPELEAVRDRVKAILADLAVLQGGRRHLLLAEPAVQDDLGLTLEQRARLPDVFRRAGETLRELPRLAAEERSRRLLAEVRAHEEVIAGLLTQAQFRRLGQIDLQVRGPGAFRDPDVAAALGLTAGQRERVREADFGPPHPVPGRGPPGPPPWEWAGPPGRGGVDRVLEVLTEEQRARWREMTGPPFAGPARPGGPSPPRSH